MKGKFEKRRGCCIIVLCPPVEAKTEAVTAEWRLKLARPEKGSVAGRRAGRGGAGAFPGALPSGPARIPFREYLSLECGNGATLGEGDRDTHVRRPFLRVQLPANTENEGR